MDKGYYSFDFDDEEDRLNFIEYVKKNNLSIARIDRLLSKHKLEYYDEFKYLLELYAREYSVDLEHLTTLSKITSLELIKNLKNKNIVSILNMSDENFNRFINLFREDNIKLNEHSLHNMFEAFAQRSFTINSHEVMAAFITTLNFINKKEYVNARNRIYSVFKYQMDLLNESKYDIDSLLEALINGDRDAIDFYHEACNKRIDEERKYYVEKTVNDYKDHYVENSFEIKQAINTILKYYNYKSLLDLSTFAVDFFTKEELNLFFNEELFSKLMSFKREHKIELTKEEKSKLFIFDRIMDKIYSKVRHLTKVRVLLVNEDVKRTYIIPDIDHYYLLDVICNIDYDKLIDVLEDKEAYEGLDKLLNTYKFLSFNNSFNGIEIDSDTYCDAITVSSIFNEYKDINKRLNELTSKINMGIVLDIADTYSDVSKKYELLFEEENFKYLTINPSPNRSVNSKNERRVESLSNLLTGYRRNVVTVPSFDKDYKLSTDKELNVVIGNFTNPLNLTLGERSGSCARSGGLGETLYNFCLTNESGFNIVFRNPEDETFVSKVSGFRNGNSVFLNQLRHSAINEYDDYDLISAMEMVAADLIKLTKDDSHPIENVIISEDMAMMNLKRNARKINFNDLFKSLGQEFWGDVSDRFALVLKTSKKNNALCEFKPGKENSNDYIPVRDRIRKSSSPSKTVSRMNALNECLNGKNIDDINIEYKPYEVCFYGEDWYVAIDVNGDIVTKVFDKSRDRMAAQNEMNKALEYLVEIDKIFNDKVK